MGRKVWKWKQATSKHECEVEVQDFFAYEVKELTDLISKTRWNDLEMRVKIKECRTCTQTSGFFIRMKCLHTERYIEQWTRLVMTLIIARWCALRLITKGAFNFCKNSELHSSLHSLFSDANVTLSHHFLFAYRFRATKTARLWKRFSTAVFYWISKLFSVQLLACGYRSSENVCLLLFEHDGQF